MATTPKTKPGEHGTLYRYRGTEDDPGRLDQPWHCWAYSLEHAEEKFYDCGDDDGWRIVSLARVSDAGSQHRAVQHAPRGGS